LSSRARLAARLTGSAAAAPAAAGWLAAPLPGALARAFADALAALFGTAFFGFAATDAFDAFVAVAAIVATVDDGDGVAPGASDAESGNAALRRAGRADPEDVTMGSSWKPRPMYRGRRRSRAAVRFFAALRRPVRGPSTKAHRNRT